MATTFDETVDNVVIGSGIGGLTVASLLSQLKRDEKTLLLEQHSTIGGNLNSFERSGYPFSVGLHWVGEMSPGTAIRKMIDALQPPGEAVEWCALPENYERLYIGREELKCFETYRKKELIQDAFPQEADKIEKFYAYGEKAANAFQSSMAFKMIPRWIVKSLISTGLFRLVSPGYSEYIRPVSKVLDDFNIKDVELRGLLTYNWQEWGSSPESCPFFYHAFVYMKHFRGGMFYPEGGPAKVRDMIVSRINACGGELRASCPVKQILVKDDRAIGVELQDGTKICARKAVISNAGYPNTFEHLLPENYVLDESLQQLKSSFTFLYLLVGLKGDHDADWKLPHQVVWLYPEGNMENLLQRYPESLTEALATLKAEDISIGVSIPSGKDKSWKEHHPDISTLEIMAGVPWTWFAEWEESAPGTRGTKYADTKSQLSQLLWTRTRQGLVEGGASTKLPLKVKDLDFHELATPLTFAHFLGREHGAFYGLEASSRRFEPSNFFLQLRPEVPEIRGLYMSGEDITTPGIVPSMISGVLAACKVTGMMDPGSLMKKLDESREQH